MYKLAYDDNLMRIGFAPIDDDVYAPYINITYELWEYLKTIGRFKLKDVPVNKTYTIEDADFFVKVEVPTDPPENQPSIDDRLAILESEQLLNVSSILDLDFRVTDIEFNMEAPITIKFENTKGEIKNMARTPYEMMQTLIVAGEYDENDMTYKIKRYHEMGKITLDQKEELLGLIEANKVIG